MRSQGGHPRKGYESVPAEALLGTDIQTQGHVQMKRRLLSFSTLNELHCTTIIQENCMDEFFYSIIVN